MDLFTRCPACETVFRVTTRHLQASGGQVKCGRCQSVFDAFASLTANPLGESRSRRMSKEEQQLPREAQSVESFRTPTASGPATDPADPDAEIVGVNGDKSKAPADLVEHGTQAIKGDSAANLYEWEFKPTPRLRYRGVWRGLTLTLLVTALLQIGYIFRTQLMINIPSLRPVYELVCERLPCDIGLPRLAEQLNIDASDLQFVDPQRPNLVQLTALVRNRARVPVEYPAFELTLTNAQQQVVARRVFLPHDYLDDSRKTEAGLGGREELAVRLFLDTGPLRAAGYRIYLFYPSPV